MIARSIYNGYPIFSPPAHYFMEVNSSDLDL